MARVCPWVKLVPRTFARVKRTERVSYRLETLSGRVVFGVHSSTMRNVLRGLRERVFAVEKDGRLVRPPQPSPEAFQRMQWFSTEVSSGITQEPLEAMAFAELYTGRKKAIYTKAAESLALTDVSNDDASLKTFVKCEKINFSSKLDPAPRVIQPRDPRYNVEVGRVLKPLEGRLLHRVGKVMKRHGKAVGPTVAKGLDASQLGKLLKRKWDTFSRPVAVGCDASRFDQHVSVDALKWEHRIYVNSTSHEYRSKLARLLSWQINNKGRAFADDGLVKYSVKGCRMSGDMNTGLGNCLIMCGMVATYMKEMGCKRYDVINNGDDCVIFVEEADLKIALGFGPWALEFGFTMVMEQPVYVLEQVEFCQMHPVLGSDGYRMVRNHSTVFSKDSVTTQNLSERGTYSAYCGAVGQGGLSLAWDIPCQGAFYAKLAEAGHTTKLQTTGGLRWWSKGMSTRVHAAPSPETRYSYWLAFKVDPTEQVVLEESFRSMSLGWESPVDKVLCRGFINTNVLC